HPMADNERRQYGKRAMVRSRRRAIQRAVYDTPDDEQRKRMRVGIADEIERREGRVAGIDADLLDAKRHENRPQQIRELGRSEQTRHRDLWRCALRGKSKREVADEHRGAMLARTQTPWP